MASNRPPWVGVDAIPDLPGPPESAFGGRSTARGGRAGAGRPRPQARFARRGAGRTVKVVTGRGYRSHAAGAVT